MNSPEQKQRPASSNRDKNLYQRGSHEWCNKHTDNINIYFHRYLKCENMHFRVVQNFSSSVDIFEHALYLFKATRNLSWDKILTI